MSKKDELNLAVLIDADNISHSKIGSILNEIKIYGIPSIKRIYGDWTRPNVGGWKEHLLTHAITPIQQYSYTSGKNSTDSALIIDAMDILHTHKADGFCIVSSDSDFTRLAIRLRESGKLVIGVGEQKTPKPFIASCDKFIYVEIFDKAIIDEPVVRNAKRETLGNNNPSRQPEKANPKVPIIDDADLLMLKETVNDVADDSGWAYLGDIGSLIIKRKPDFDARNYGFSKLSPLFKSLDSNFEVDERSAENSRIKRIYIKNRLIKDVLVIKPKRSKNPVSKRTAKK